MQNNHELRFSVEPAEVRSMGSGKLVATGLAAVFESRSEPLGATGFRESVGRSAFNRTLANGTDVLALLEHDKQRLLGRSGAGTLRLKVEERGLRYEIDLDDRQSLHRDVASQLERGDLAGSSFGFRAIDDKWTVDEAGTPRRELLEVHLRDVGPTSQPAYTSSDAGLAVRSLSASSGLSIEDLLQASPADLAEAVRLSEKRSEAESEKEAERSTSKGTSRRYHRRIAG